MKFFKSLEKNVKDWHILSLLGLLVVGYIIYEYSMKKGMFKAGMAPSMASSSSSAPSSTSSSAPSAFDKATTNLNMPSTVESSGDMITSGGCGKEITNPADLLPKSGSSFDVGAPSDPLSQVNLLSAGHHVGINTVGGSLRNANRQVRSEPPNPVTKNLCPWNNSTIEPDTMRLPLEIGCKC